MRIRELNIERFGGLDGLKIDLAGGLNLVYGENEAGKSTVLSFIRAMFYGLNGNARRIVENERKHRLPWGYDRMGGWLAFEHGGRSYRIERTFGNARRQDQRVLRDDISGKPVDLPGAQEIGDWLFGVRESEFLNTVCIGQLATAAVTAEDSTLAKLANLAATGDERVSSAEVDARLRKAMVTYRAEKGNGGRINQLADREQTLLGERQVTLAREAERSACIQQYQNAVNDRDRIGHLLLEGRSLMQACRDRAAIRLSAQRTERLAELHGLERAAGQLGSALQWEGRMLTRSDLAELQARRDRVFKGLARQDEIRQQHDLRLASLAELQARKSDDTGISRIDADGCLSLLDEAAQLERDAFAVRRSLLTVGELQGSQASLMSRRSEAQGDCEAAQQALDEHQDQAAAELQQAEMETGRRQQAWEACLLALAERRTAHEAATHRAAQDEEARKTASSGRSGQVRSRVKPLLLAAGLLFALAGLAGGLSLAPALYFLIPVGLLAVGLSFWLAGRPSGQSARLAVPAGGSVRTDETGSIAGDPLLDQLESQAEALKRDWTDSAGRLDGLRDRLAQRAQKLAAELETCHEAWLAAVERERQAAVTWQAALDELQRDPLWQRITESGTAMIPDMDFPAQQSDRMSAADPETLSRQTQLAASSIQKLHAALQKRLAEVRQVIDGQLREAGCATAEIFRQKLDEWHGLSREEAHLRAESSQLLDALDAAAAANDGLERSLRGDLQALAGMPDSQAEAEPDPDLDHLLESVRQRLNDWESHHTAIREKRQALADLPDSQEQPDEDAVRERLEHAFPDGDTGLASALFRFVRSAGTWIAPPAGPASLAGSASMAGPASTGGLDTLEAEGPAAMIAVCTSRLAPLLDGLQTARNSLAAEAVRLESELTHRFSQLRSLEDIDLDLATAERQLQVAQTEHAALALARETIDEAFQELQQTFGPQLNRRGGDILARLSGGHYADMRVDRNLQIAVPDPQTGQLHEAGYLSGGTMDQAYLSLRLAVSELIASPANRLPLLLDDVLTQYDDHRAAAGLAFLREYAEEQDLQILLFTCHGRLLTQADAVPASHGCHVIRLG